MEVHHHSHTSPAQGRTGRRKWTHYFWEFLMLFFAVFCGFLAENQREHMIENKREKDYIKLFIEDLQNDTAIIRGVLPEMKKIVSGLDTLIDESYAVLDGTGDTRIMYYAYHHYCRNLTLAMFSQRALNQLKNSGNMRLIRNKEALKIILDVEVGFQNLEEEIRKVIERQENPSQFGTKIFDFREYKKANTNPDGSINNEERGFLQLNYQPALNTTDVGYIKEFIARVGYHRNTFDGYLQTLELLIPFLEKAITDLKKNYRFK